MRSFAFTILTLCIWRPIYDIYILVIVRLICVSQFYYLSFNKVSKVCWIYKVSLSRHMSRHMNRLNSCHCDDSVYLILPLRQNQKFGCHLAHKAYCLIFPSKILNLSTKINLVFAILRWKYAQRNFALIIRSCLFQGAQYLRLTFWISYQIQFSSTI